MQLMFIHSRVDADKRNCRCKDIFGFLGAYALLGAKNKKINLSKKRQEVEPEIKRVLFINRHRSTIIVDSMDRKFILCQEFLKGHL